MTFPIWILLLFYIFALVLGGIFVAINVYHLSRFGVKSPKTRIVAGVYIASYVAVVFVTAMILVMYDWTAVVGLGDMFQANLILE